MIDAKELKHSLAGKWDFIAFNLAPSITPAIEKKGRHIACPVHGGKDGFRVYKDFSETGGGVCNTCGTFSDGISLIQWLTGWKFKEVLKALNDYQSVNNQSVSYLRSKPRAEVKPNLKQKQSIDEVLRKASSLKGVVKDYLEHRGLSLLHSEPPKDLLSIDSLLYWEDKKKVGYFPAMIGVVRSLSGEVITLHRTYLNDAGYKANVSAPKKLMPPALSGACAGAAIHLYQPTERLAITEGIETALAVHLSTGLPVWAAISATMMEKVEIPISVKDVYIMADKDKSGVGVRSAFKLAKRLSQSHVVRVVTPDQEIPKGAKSIDWLDVYQLETGFNAVSGGRL